MARPELRGAGVLVTRPDHQADRLCALIEAAGGRAIRFPVLAIAAPRDDAPALALIARLAQYSLAIFISANAVERGLDLIESRLGALPPQLRIAAVGAATARELRRRLGRDPDLVPQGRYDSEALLALPQLQTVAGSRIAIFRGEGGRELLADTLRERGAAVEYAEVYRRVPPLADGAALTAQLVRGEVDIVTVTSSEGLRNLLELAGDESGMRLRQLPLVVVSERTAALAHTLGFAQPALVAREASDQGLVEAVAHWMSERANDPGEGR